MCRGTASFICWLPILLVLALPALYNLPAELSAFDGARSGRHFAVPVGHAAGKPQPLGPTLVAASQASRPQDAACTLNFAVRERVPGYLAETASAIEVL
jgi:hypothetical protein